MTDQAQPDEPDLAAAVLRSQRSAAALDVLHTYVDRVDAGDIEAVGALFRPDATYDFMGNVSEGRDVIVVRLRQALSEFDRTSHHVSNALVGVDGDTASVSASLYAFHRRSQDGIAWHFWGRYKQRLVRRNVGWVIAHMQLIGIDAEPLAPAERSLLPGRPDRRSVERP